MKGSAQHEAASGHERWLVSYADLMTLLFAVFVVLFASALQHDRHGIQKISSSVKGGFADLGVFHGSAHVEPGAAVVSAGASADRKSSGVDTAELQRKLSKALGKEIAQQEVGMKTTPEGFVISLHELGFFNSGEAALLPGAAEKIRAIAAVLTEYGLDMRVEGHTDNVPIHNGAFASNWELSVGRASVVAMMLLKDERFDPRRMAIAGYGEFHPAESNDTAEGRRANRRVDIVILGEDGGKAAVGLPR